MANMQFAGSVALTVSGTTPQTGPTETVAASVSHSSGAVLCDDFLSETFTVNAGTTATLINLGKLVSGAVLYIKTSSPILVTTTEDLADGAGALERVQLVNKVLYKESAFTALKLANNGATAAQVALVVAGARAAVGSTPGIF